MLQLIRLADGSTLHDAFSVNVCGRDLRHGKPDPEIFQLAAEELHVAPAHCFVAEDAPAGIQAARAGGMAALGVARLHDEAGLHAAHADVVVATREDVEMSALAGGCLRRRPS
jgi:beta-phosphoglucomutase